MSNEENNNIEELKEPTPISKNEVSTNKNVNKNNKVKLISVALVGGLVAIAIFMFFSNPQVGLALSLNNTLNAYEKEIESVTKNNDMVSAFEDVFKDNYKVDASFISSSIPAIYASTTNDRKNEAIHTELNISELVNMGLYITNENNYIELNDIAYNFDTEEGLYKLLSWIVDANIEYLSEEELKTIEEMREYDLNYNLYELLEADAKELRNLTNKEINDYFKELFLASEIVESKENVFLDGVEKEATVHSFNIDLEKVTRDLYDIQAKHSNSLNNNLDSIDLLFSQYDFEETNIKLYEYNDYIVKYAVETKVTDLLFNTTGESEFYLAHNSTSNMLGYIEVGFKDISSGIKNKVVFENDIYNSDYIKLNVSSYGDEELYGVMSVDWDFKKETDNLLITINDLYLDIIDEISLTFVNDKDSVKIEYFDDNTGSNFLLDIVKTDEEVTTPENSSYLYDITYNDLVMEFLGIIFGGMF